MDLLHPQLLSRQQLLDIFRQRHFTIPRLEEASRDELIQLYTKHLLPQPRRGAPGSVPSAAPQDVEMKEVDNSSPSNGGDASRKRNSVRQRIVYGGVDNVSHGMKKIRLISGSSGSVANETNGTGNGSFTETREQQKGGTLVVKRPLEVSPGKVSTVNATTSNPTSKRQKITWP